MKQTWNGAAIDDGWGDAEPVEETENWDVKGGGGTAPILDAIIDAGVFVPLKKKIKIKLNILFLFLSFFK